MSKLTESYKGRLAISEKFYAQNNGGAKLSNKRKEVTAMCLDNTARFLNEAFEVAAGTQRSDMGMYKVFCMDITTLTVPNLVVNDIFMVKPMTSFTANLIYMQYGLGTAKGGVGGRDDEGNFNTIVASPFTYGAMNADRVNYSGDRVAEAVAADATTIAPAWTPVVGGKVEAHNASTGEWTELAVGATIVAGTYDKIRYQYDNITVSQRAIPSLEGRMANITLTAHARRLGVKYSQMAAFQA